MKTLKLYPKRVVESVFYLFTVFFLLSGCSSYQYVRLSSSMASTDKNEFVFENDTLAVVYSFDGYACPVNITIYNKLSTPLYVDWTRSSAIVDGKTLGYSRDEMKVDVASYGYTTHWNESTSTTSSLSSGVISRDYQLTFIPPSAYISVVPIYIQGASVPLPSESLTGNVHLYTDDGVGKGKRYTFEANSSPLYFRSYLSLSTTSDFSKPFTLDDQFWASEVITTGVNPSRLSYSMGNQFYIKTSNGSRRSTTAVIGLLLLGALVVAAN
ncbi:MAG: hypothetical protein RBT74_06650 [Tenuifilaceae bacterium]|jgi:hypothetical protein|nr:hypothetical protein [Tenuifilaceae bacterium]